MTNFSLEGKVAIVTGCRRGIGKSIALAFAEAGADLAINDLVVEDGLLASVAEEIGKLGRRCIVVPADVTIKADVDRMVERVVGEFGKIDILVNNVGAILRKTVLESDEDDWNKIMDTNVKSAFFCSQAVSKVMVARKTGSIINLSSLCAHRASIQRGVYNVAKAGVSMLTQMLALELAGDNVRVNAIAPGGVKTDWNVWEWDDPKNLERPMKRMAESSELTGAAIFLASEASGYVTGHVLFVDGGESL